jgi:uncharacterized protein
VTDLATTDDIRLLALDRYLEPMRQRFGEAYESADVEAEEYTGVPATKTIGVPNLLVVREDMSDELAHSITQVLFDGKPKLAEIHQAAENLEVDTAQEIVQPVQLHPGAERFYGEQR